MYTRPAKNVAHTSQRKQSSLPKAYPDQPNSSARGSDGTRTTDSSGSVNRSTRKTAPPSTPLPPLPQDARPARRTPEVPTKVSTSSPRKSTEATQIATTMAADVANKSSMFHPSISRPKLMGEARMPSPKPQTQGTENEFGENVVPDSESHPRLQLSDASPLPPAKSGLLTRFKTRLNATRSSPSLRPSPSAASSEEPSKGGTLDTLHAQEDANPPGDATLVPVRTAPPVPDEKPKLLPKQQSLGGRLSLAALAERRAEKRDAKVREEQRATNARRAAALAKTGLLPASRRYSLVQASADEYGQSPAFDPFAKDGVQRDQESDDGVVVEEPKPDTMRETREEGEGGFSAAEIVIREWRERNGHLNDAPPPPDVLQSQDMPVEQGGSQDIQQQVQENGKNESNRPASNDVVASTPSYVDQLSSSPALTTSLEDHQASGLPLDARDHDSSSPHAVGPTEASNAANPPSPSLPGTVEDEETVLSKLNLEKQHSVLPPLPSKNPRSLKKAKAVREENERDIQLNLGGKATDKAKADGEERTTLDAWRFPPSCSSPTSVSSGTTTPQKAKESTSNDIHPSSPTSPRSASSGSTAVANQSQSESSHQKDAPPPPPPKSKKGASGTQDGKEGESHPSQTQSVLSPTSPAQIPLPASPTIPIPPSPLSRHGSSTSPSQRSRAQKHANGPIASSQALAVCLPALSPTTSTSTSTSGSALPRTPSTSSHGHSPVRILDAPLENDEDAFLRHGSTELSSIAESKPEVKVTCVKEFGQLAKLAELDPEQADVGALPPLPPISSSDLSTGSGSTPRAEYHPEEEDRRKRTTLFGRRRATTQNGPPMIVIPEKNADMPLTGNATEHGQEAGGSGKPRHASSFTNLRRTVTSVTTGLANAAGAAIRPSRDRSPLRGATMPIPQSLGSPRLNSQGATSLSPSRATISTPGQRFPGVGLRPRPLNPTMHSRGSILLETHAIEDEESRRLAELAFLD